LDRPDTRAYSRSRPQINQLFPCIQDSTFTKKPNPFRATYQ
jgi:hypothetical protein